MLEDILDIKVNNDLELIKKLRANDKPLFLFGAGVMAHTIYERFIEQDIKITAFVVDDKKTSAVDPALKDFKILESKELDELYNGYIVVLAFHSALKDVEKFSEKFKKAAEIKTYISIFDSLEELTPEYFKDHYQEFEATCQMLADDKSKECMAGYLKAKISSDPKFLRPHQSTGVQYFSEEFLRISPNESYVDCGTYDGDSIRDFLQETGGSYNYIWALEPDPANAKLVTSFIDRNKLTNIELIEACVSSEKTKVPFVMSHDQGARVADGSETFVECDTIDNITKGREVSFIKMDIEGSELAALKGAEQAIKKYKPNLAISVYHRADDFLAIPRYLHELAPEYKFYVRLYWLLPVDAVLFATVR